jgi:hypothetical protein
MPANGDVNSRFGIYRTLCCGQEIVITVGASFPDCPKHPKLSTEWKPVIEADGVIHLEKRGTKNNERAA